MFLPVTKVLQVSQPKVLRASEQEIRKQLLPPLEFDYLRSPFPPHEAWPGLPGMPTEQNHSPFGLFSLIFMNSILEFVVVNTNRYVERQRLTTNSWKRYEIAVISCM